MAVQDTSLLSKEAVAEHYTGVALDYDSSYQVQSRAIANFIQKIVALDADSQVIDVGGGTAQVSLLIKEDLGMTRPVVCVDPNREMLSVARSKGAIAIESTAEEFFASKPNFPLKVIFMIGCIHHFERPEFIFSKMASYMPEDGVCIACKYPPNTTLPFFKAAKDAYMKTSDILEEIYLHTNFNSMGLKCRKVLGVETGNIMDKALWYKSIRNRLASFLQKFSDEELEEGIKELEEEFGNQTVLNMSITIKALILTKKSCSTIA